MISSLAAIGVPAAKIRIVFNRVEREVEAEFRIIIGYYRQNRSFWLNTDCAIFETELFDALAIKRLPTQSLLEDQADYRTLLKDKEAPAADRNNWSDMFGLKLLAKGVNKSLDHVFEELIKGKTL